MYEYKIMRLVDVKINNELSGILICTILGCPNSMAPTCDPRSSYASAKTISFRRP